MKAKIYYLLFIGLFAWSSGQSQDISRFKNAKPFEISGAIGGNVGAYSVSGLDYRASPFRYGLTARLNVKIYSIDLPIYATLRDHSFNYGTSFSRIRINPRYKWVKLHIGDVYMNFNRYTLSGRTVRGLGVELTPGKFRLKTLYGKIEDLRSFSDTLLLGTTFMPTYSRRLAALGVGFGSSSSYFDIYAVRTWDNIDSLNGRPLDEQIRRQSNTVAGSTLRIRFGPHVSLQSNFGLSFLTENLDSFGENFVVGSNNVTSNILEGNLSSSLTYAGDVGLNYTGRLFSLNGNVQYIQPYYQPLSVAFINSDLINYTIGGGLSLFKRAVNLTGSIGIQSNNLTGSKISTSNHIIGSLAANIRFNQAWSANLNYFNFSQDFQAQLIQIDDIYTYAVSNNIATAALRHTFKKGEIQYTTIVRGGRNDFYTIDDNEVEQGAYSSFNGGIDFSLYDPDRELRLSGGLSYRHYLRENTTLTNYGMRVSVRKGWFENRLSGQFTSNFFLNDNGDKREGFTLRNTIGSDYKLNPSSSVGLHLNQIYRTSSIRNNFSEFRADLRYIYQFHSSKR